MALLLYMHPEPDVTSFDYLKLTDVRQMMMGQNDEKLDSRSIEGES